MFAYGMNTNLSQMQKRCPTAIKLGPARLLNHKFAFRTHADVDDDHTSHVDGVLWRIQNSDLLSLDALEGYPTYYTRKWAIVSHNGKEMMSLVYQMTSVNKTKLTLPAEYYFSCVVEGYKENNVPTEQIFEALCNAAATEKVEAL